MKEIKFRFWDVKEFLFIPWISIRSANLYDYLNKNESINPQQYIGEKDKNGVEIYDGDIFKFYVGSRALRKVIFQSGSFGVVGVTDDREKTFTEFIPFATMNQSLIEQGIYDEINSLIEVVGNIHENPELLKA
ncbi:TIGR01671 family protein [Chryseobacterium sp. StRB126]|uniref:YopX family protein n=1 Tax=Chryseobacterium sp. StRB126 TaxID=878220 RepID=UPI0004E99A45|nr:YopX family protein [Chryseobacterium sp. StRB126]BAP30158.1 TIGR01671 family protein [Chryseobacterium sp. StRB126]